MQLTETSPAKCRFINPTASENTF